MKIELELQLLEDTEMSADEFLSIARKLENQMEGSPI